MGITIVGNRGILQLVYSSIDAEVMDNAMTYFFLSALSYPFLAVYNSGADPYSKITMYLYS